MNGDVDMRRFGRWTGFARVAGVTAAGFALAVIVEEKGSAGLTGVGGWLMMSGMLMVWGSAAWGGGAGGGEIGRAHV